MVLVMMGFIKVVDIYIQPATLWAYYQNALIIVIALFVMILSVSISSHLHVGLVFNVGYY